MKSNLNPLFMESTVARRLVDSGKATPKQILMFKKLGWIPTKKKETLGLHKAGKNMIKKAGYKTDSRGNQVFNSVTIPHDTKGLDDMDSQSLANAMAFFSGQGSKKGLQPGTAYIPKYPFKYYGKGSKVKVHIKKENPLIGDFDMEMSGRANPMQAAIASWHEGREAARSKTKLGKKFLETLRNDEAFGTTSKNFGNHVPGTMGDERRLFQRLKRRHGVDMDKDGIISNTKAKTKMFGETNVVPVPTTRNELEKKIALMTPKQDFEYRLKLSKGN